MAWQVTTDPSVFVGAVAPLLAARRVELTVPAGIVDTLRRRGPSPGSRCGNGSTGWARSRCTAWRGTPGSQGTTTLRSSHRGGPRSPPRPGSTWSPRPDLVSAAVDEGRVVLWTVAREARSMAAVPLLGCGRIAPVYTPPTSRRCGYGAGAVTAACSLLRGRGDEEVLLFTDLANRTSNALYARIGFVGVLNLVEVVS